MKGLPKLSSSSAFIVYYFICLPVVRSLLLFLFCAFEFLVADLWLWQAWMKDWSPFANTVLLPVACYRPKERSLFVVTMEILILWMVVPKEKLRGKVLNHELGVMNEYLHQCSPSVNRTRHCVS